LEEGNSDVGVRVYMNGNVHQLPRNGPGQDRSQIKCWNVGEIPNWL